MAKMRYKMSSRAAILLGRESVTKADNAIIELVKNSYDADADFSYIKFDLQQDCLYILDNGAGMTEEIINSNWMVIGTDNKLINYQSQKSRVKSGEKGVGRLSLDRLGETCEMYTKNEKESINYWEIDFSQFEIQGKMLEDIEVGFSKIDDDFEAILPQELKNDIYNDEFLKSKPLNTGTLLIIKNLRDNWNDNKIDKLLDSLSFLIPPKDKIDYELLAYNPQKKEIEILRNDFSNDYDYKIYSKYTDGLFHIEIFRNEWDIKRFPKNLLDVKFLENNYPDLQSLHEPKVTYKLSVEQLLNRYLGKNLNKDINSIKNELSSIGEFEFNFMFLKANNSQQDPSYFVKNISAKRKQWLDMYSGIKIYRDNFIVRPYGFVNSNAYDWLGLDHRKNKSPASPSHKSGSWRVRNKQIQGSLSISRVLNPNIKDISSREALVDNDEFQTLKEILHAIISIFEKDRAEIFLGIRKYNEDLDEVEKTKVEAEIIARKIGEKEKKDKIKKKIDLTKMPQNKMIDLYNETEKSNLKMAKAIGLYKDETKELYTELKLLRELSTSGLITTSIVHDLRTLKGTLSGRSLTLKEASEINETEFDKNLNLLKVDDLFLKSWIEVILNQDQNKRKKLKHDLREVLLNLIEMINPILEKKGIVVITEFPEVDVECFKKIYESDFNSIFYNLIINSIESFESYNRGFKEIKLNLSVNENKIKIIYSDNGKGIPDDIFVNKNDIFTFGITSKRDLDGEINGTGLGMYIVSSTLNEYSAKYNLLDKNDGFGLEMIF